MGVLMLVSEGRTVGDDADGDVVTKVEEGSGASVGPDMPDVLTRDAPTDKRLSSWLYASSGLKVDVTVGRVTVSDGPTLIVIITTGVDDGVGGVESVGFRSGSGMEEFGSSVETIPPFPPAPFIIERALDSEVHPTN